jgi:predicted metalloprotease with PDZ domain
MLPPRRRRFQVPEEHNNLPVSSIVPRNHRSALLVTFLILVVHTASAADLTVRLDARDVARKRVHADLTLSVEPGPLTLVFPKWIPGEHAPTGPLESMIGLEINAGGQRLAWSRDPIDVYAFNVTVPDGVDRLQISLDTGLATEGDGFSAAPTSSARLAVLPWNEFVLLPRGRDAEQISTAASVVVPGAWSVATALAVTRAADGSYALEEASLTRLIDSPVQIGRYAKHVSLPGSAPRPELEHSISIAADSAAALEVPDDLAAGYTRLVAEAGALFGSRMYRHYTWLLTLSDHVAHFGLEHHESSDNRRDERTLIDPALRPWLSTLLGHEYVHSWNGKYRRPRGLLSPDYDQPMDASLLWVYEGLTEFWGDILPTRAGLLSETQYREELASYAAVFDNEPGADWRPLADTAVAAQNLYSAPEAFRSSRRDTDFYDASVFMWLDIDAEIRARTQGQKSLDDFMQLFYAGKSGEPALEPYDEQDVYDGLAAVAPGEWRDFVRRHLDSTGTQALFGALERSGWRLEYSSEKNAYIEYWQARKETVERMASIGLRLDKDAVVLDVVKGRAAAKAGAAPGMALVAVDGRKYTPAVLDQAIEAAASSHHAIDLLVENDDFYRTLEVNYFDGPRYPHLVRIDGTEDALTAVLTPRTVKP